ncbi:MAG: hypothetical protein ACOC33_03500 [bacterium]
MAVDFKNIDSIIGGFNKILQLSSIGGPPPVPTPLILVGAPRRPGLSPTKIASKIIARKSEAGLPVGALPSGSVNPDEIMERIRIEEIVKALQQDALISVGVPLGIPIQAAGLSPAGPVTVTGLSIRPIKGYGVIQ